MIYNYFEQLCFGFVQIVEWQFNMALAGVNMALAGVNIALAVLNMASWCITSTECKTLKGERRMIFIFNIITALKLQSGQGNLLSLW